MENNAASRLYLGCNWKEFSETPHFPLKAKDLRCVKDGCNRSSLRENNVPSQHYLAYNRRDFFLKLHSCHSIGVIQPGYNFFAIGQ